MTLQIRSNYTMKFCPASLCHFRLMNVIIYIYIAYKQTVRSQGIILSVSLWYVRLNFAYSGTVIFNAHTNKETYKQTCMRVVVTVYTYTYKHTDVRVYILYIWRRTAALWTRLNTLITRKPWGWFFEDRNAFVLYTCKLLYILIACDKGLMDKILLYNWTVKGTRDEVS
jgi:hypothetical protein